MSAEQLNQRYSEVDQAMAKFKEEYGNQLPAKQIPLVPTIFTLIQNHTNNNKK